MDVSISQVRLRGQWRILHLAGALTLWAVSESVYLLVLRSNAHVFTLTNFLGVPLFMITSN